MSFVYYIINKKNKNNSNNKRENGKDVRFLSTLIPYYEMNKVSPVIVGTTPTMVQVMTETPAMTTTTKEAAAAMMTTTMVTRKVECITTDPCYDLPEYNSHSNNERPTVPITMTTTDYKSTPNMNFSYCLDKSKNKKKSLLSLLVMTTIMLQSPGTVQGQSRCFQSGDSLPDAIDQYIKGYSTVRTTYGSRINSWCFSQYYTSFYAAFYDQPSFNEIISAWDTSSVTDMSSTFELATSFNQDLSKWNVRKVQDFSWMFAYATTFNGDISTWDTSSATNMSAMFDFSFNQDLSKWNVARVQDFSWMFGNASVFNGDVTSWATSSAITMSGMFWATKSFNQDLSKWDVSKVTDFSGMFNASSSFRKNLCTWGSQMVGRKIYVNDMFKGTACPNPSDPVLVGNSVYSPLCYDCTSYGTPQATPSAYSDNTPTSPMTNYNPTPNYPTGPTPSASSYTSSSSSSNLKARRPSKTINGLKPGAKPITTNAGPNYKPASSSPSSLYYSMMIVKITLIAFFYCLYP